MKREILSQTIAVENDLIVITEETLTRKDRRQLENDLISVQRQMANCVEQNKRLLEEYSRLQIEEQEVLGMIAQLPTSSIEAIE